MLFAPSAITYFRLRKITSETPSQLFIYLLTSGVFKNIDTELWHRKQIVAGRELISYIEKAIDQKKD